MTSKIVISVDGTANSGSTTIAYLMHYILGIGGVKTTVTDRDGVMLTPFELRDRLDAIKKRVDCGELVIDIKTGPLTK
jgi:adenylylsulfate kinase-like enzyme